MQAYNAWLGRVANRQPPTAEGRWVAFRPPGAGETAPGPDEPYDDEAQFTHVLLPINELKLLKGRLAR